MKEDIIKAVIEMLRVTLGSMSAREADRLVQAAIDILETQVSRPKQT